MTIETERLILRPFAVSDAADVYEYLHEQAVNCFASMRLDTLADAEAEMKKRVGETEFYFAITLKDTGKVIGEIVAYPEPGEPHAGEGAPQDTFSPCWMLNLSYTGKGYAYEAVHAFFDYLFHEKGARRIYAYTEDDNLASQRLCERLGMRREGLFLEFISFVNNPDGTPLYENTCQYAILKKEWDFMSEQTTRDNRTLVEFWDQAFAIPEEEKEAARREGVGSLEELAPVEKLLQAVSALGGRRKVLDYGCGNGWAAIAAAKSGCKEVTAADPAPNAVETARFLAELCGVSVQVRPVCGGIDWLKTIPAETYDGLICSNVLDVIPPETAGEVLRELARVVTPDAEIVVGLNYEMTPEAAAEKGLTLTDDRRVYQDGVLRLVSRSDTEWAAFLSPFFTVERLEHFAWPGEDEGKRRLFHLRRRQSA